MIYTLYLGATDAGTDSAASKIISLPSKKRYWEQVGAFRVKISERKDIQSRKVDFMVLVWYTLLCPQPRAESFDLKPSRNDRVSHRKFMDWFKGNYAVETHTRRKMAIADFIPGKYFFKVFINM